MLFGERPPKKPTKGEIRDRIAFVRLLLAQGLTHTGDIKRAVRKQYGKLSGRTIQTYLSRARAQNRAEQELPVADQVADSLAYWDGVISNPKEQRKHRNDARRQKDKILGLERVKHEHSGKVDVNHSADPLQIAKLRQDLFKQPEIVDPLRQQAVEEGQRQTAPKAEDPPEAKQRD